MLVPSFGVLVPQDCKVAAAFGGCPLMLPEVGGPGPVTTSGTVGM